MMSVGITLDTYSHVMPGMQEETGESLLPLPRSTPPAGGPGHPPSTANLRSTGRFPT
jgi:hypothetical protein